jgi:hypothetical protein
VEQAPTDRAEDPFAEEQWSADGGEEAGNEERAGGEPAEDRGTLDRVADFLELGPGELDVGIKQSLRGVPGRPDLLTQARRIGAVATAAGSAGSARRARRGRRTRPRRSVRLRRDVSAGRNAGFGRNAARRVGCRRIGIGAWGGRLRIVQGIGLRWAARQGLAAMIPAPRRRSPARDAATASIPWRFRLGQAAPRKARRPSRSAASKKP